METVIPTVLAQARWHRFRLAAPTFRSLIYGFFPISTCMAAGLLFGTSMFDIALASTFSACNAETKAAIGEANLIAWLAYVPTTMPTFEITPAFGNSVLKSMRPPPSQSICCQPASLSTFSMIGKKASASGSADWTAISNSTPANCLSASLIRCRASELSHLGFFNRSNSSCASVARAFASATMPSPASLARREKRNSPQTPAIISKLAMMFSAISSHDFPRMNAATISTMSPTIIRRAIRSAQVELNSYLDWRSPVLLPLVIGLIRPGPRKRSKMTEWMAGCTAIGSLIALAVVTFLHLVGKWP